MGIKKNFELLLLVLFSALIIYSVFNHEVILSMLSAISAMLSPVIMGLAIAFVLNIPLKFIENRLLVFMNRNDKLKKKKRLVSILLTFLATIAFFIFIVAIILPDINTSIELLNERAPIYAAQVVELINSLIEQYDLEETLLNIGIDWQSIISTAADFATGILTAVIGELGSISASVINTVISTIIAIYLLSDKENLIANVKLTTKAFVPSKISSRIFEISTFSNTIFTNFVTGQLLEAVILGTLVFIGMMLFSFPFPLLVSVVIGITALVPIFGAYIGAFFGAFIILLVSPLQALWFLIFVTIVQQIEGNVIYPRVVGTSIGLPALWVITSIMIFSYLFGIPGILLGVPVTSVLYSLFREYVKGAAKKREKLESRNME